MLNYQRLNANLELFIHSEVSLWQLEWLFGLVGPRLRQLGWLLAWRFFGLATRHFVTAWRLGGSVTPVARRLLAWWLLGSSA